jgi:hypothetical protein
MYATAVDQLHAIAQDHGLSTHELLESLDRVSTWEVTPWWVGDAEQALCDLLDQLVSVCPTRFEVHAVVMNLTSAYLHALEDPADLI